MGRIKLIHYHTNTENAMPAAENLALGEIAVNTNPRSPQLIIKNSNGSIEKISADSSKFVVPIFTQENNSYTAIDPKTQTTAETKGYISSFYVWKTAGASHIIPNFSAGAFSSGLFFGADDTKGTISISHNIPTIVFSANASSQQNTPAWVLKLTGASKTYDLENFTAATAKKTSGTLSIADRSFNGSADLAINELDCGEF